MIFSIDVLMKDGIWVREGLRVFLLPPAGCGGRPRGSHRTCIARHWCHGGWKQRHIACLGGTRGEGWSGDGVRVGEEYAEEEPRAVQRRAWIGMSVCMAGVLLSSRGVYASDGERRLTREQRVALQNVSGALRQRGMEEPVQRVPAASGRMQTALKLLQDAYDEQGRGEFQGALEKYRALVLEYPEFEGLGERGRVGQALMEYQVGMVDAAILHLEDEEVALRGLAEVHAALASVLYAERPERLAFAELQFEIASEFDSRYSSVAWVKKEKKWPPRMLHALESFLTLKSG